VGHPSLVVVTVSQINVTGQTSFGEDLFQEVNFEPHDFYSTKVGFHASTACGGSEGSIEGRLSLIGGWSLIRITARGVNESCANDLQTLTTMDMTISDAKTSKGLELSPFILTIKKK
jgi:hypothetical protein